MFLKSCLKVALVSSLVLCSAIAQGDKVEALEISQSDIQEQNELVESESVQKAKTTNEFFREFEKEHKIKYGISKNGKTFFRGEGTAVFKAGDPEFGKAITVAYEKAILDLQKNYIVDTFGTAASQRVADFYQDSSTNAREFEKEIKDISKLGAIVDKFLDFASGKLDEWLLEMGIEPSKLTETQRKTLAKQEFIKEVVKQAHGSMSGLVPIQTHLTVGEDGIYSIAVIAIISDKTRQVARDMSLQRKSVITGKGKDIEEFLPEDDKDYLNEFGIRMVYNEKGEPTIISYGRWSYVKNSRDAYLNRMAKQSAFEQAQSLADAMIVEFMNTNLSFNSKSQTGEIVQSVLEKEVQLKSGDETITEQNITAMVDKFSSQIKANAKGSLRGVSKVHEWEAQDDNKIEYVGVVRVWSYSNVEAVQNMLNPKKETKQAKPTAKKQVNDTSRTSKKVNDVDDF